MPHSTPSKDTRRRPSEWTPDEHSRFLEALALFPHSRWRVLAEYIGTRTTRQVMTHAQKHSQRLQRHERGLLVAGRRQRGNPSPRRKRSAPSSAVNSPTLAEPRQSISASHAAVTIPERMKPCGDSFVSLLESEVAKPAPASVGWNSGFPTSPTTPGWSTNGGEAFGEWSDGPVNWVSVLFEDYDRWLASAGADLLIHRR